MQGRPGRRAGLNPMAVSPPFAADAGLSALFRATESFVPGMRGGVGPPRRGEISALHGNGAALADLLDAVRADQPRAGHGYWRLRVWALLEWQPAAIAVMGVHLFDLSPPLQSVSLIPRGAGVLGYRFADPVARHGAGALEHAAAGLRALSERLLADLRPLAPVRPELARRLLADRVLGVILRLARARPGAFPDGPEAAAARWLAAAGLEGASVLERIPCRGGDAPILRRRACCLAYMRDDGVLCDSCPHLPDDERRARAMQELEAPDA